MVGGMYEAVCSASPEVGAGTTYMQNNFKNYQISQSSHYKGTTVTFYFPSAGLYK